MEMTLEEFKQELRGGARAIVQFRHAERPKMDPDDPSFGDALPLTPEGARTARRLGELLGEFAADTSFCASPLTRTRMTAELIAAGMGLDGAPVPTDDLLGNGSFYYSDAAQVLEVFQPKNFFPACFEYFATGEQRGFKNLYAATETCERWLEEKAKTKLLVVATHDVYIAAFLYAKGAVRQFSKANWPRFLDGAAIIHRPDGSTAYALVRTGLSDGIVGVRKEDIRP